MAGKFIPGLETDQDRLNEIDVLSRVSEKYKRISYEQTPKFTRYDANLYVDDNLYAIVEIKCRKEITHDRFNSVILRTDKWKACQRIAKEKNVKFLVFFRYLDGIFFLDETNTKINEGGRSVGSFKPKNNPYGESEEVIFFPLNLLKKLV